MTILPSIETINGGPLSAFTAIGCCQMPREFNYFTIVHILPLQEGGIYSE